MELPRSRPIGTQGRKPTHDFLSLYSTSQQDPRLSQGGHVKTQDFLQPLEQVGKNIGRGENKIEPTAVGKPPPSPPSLGEHILPGGIGTYSINHISYINQGIQSTKSEGGVFTVAEATTTDRNENNSNSSSYSGSGFTLWEESVMKKGKTGKENIVEDSHAIREAAEKTRGGQWTTSLEPSALSSSSHKSPSTMFNNLSSSQPLPAQKNQSFIDMLKSAKSLQEDDDDDDEDDDFVIKKKLFSHHRGNMSLKFDGKETEQHNTPRSKHSATEQRRRCKINDRFQMLRGIIPHSDQKRDKASFLLEVIEYIQFLQEKVHKYESHQGWNQLPPKLVPWRNSHGLPDGFVDQSLVTNLESASALMFAAKFDEKNISVSSSIPKNGQNPVEFDMSSANTLKAMDHLPALTNKASSSPLVQKIFSSGVATSRRVIPSTEENRVSLPQSQVGENRTCTTTDCTVVSDKLKEQELTIESGGVSISSAYSQGLLNTLTQAFQSSGVNLSQASISVQINLGKGENSKMNSSTAAVKDDVPSRNQTMARSRIAISGDESNQALKRLKRGRS